MRHLALYLALCSPNTQEKPPAPPPIDLPEAPHSKEPTGLPLSRWTFEVFMVHDPSAGWGASERMEYRFDHRWSMKLEQNRAITQGGISLRVGKIK